MDIKLKEEFIKKWQKYFNSVELPITFYYTDQDEQLPLVKAGPRHCILSDLGKVRQGHTIAFDAESGICFGGRKYLGFSRTLRPDFEHFISCGMPGKVEGERYKRSPEIVREYLNRAPQFTAPAKDIVFKRWDTLEAADNPQVVIFFAKPDILAGLYTLANFESANQNVVIAPWGSGCSSIIQHPYLEKDSADPRGIIGMFDPSARPFVGPDELTFSIALNKFMLMVQNIEESFLTTETWKAIQKRIQ